MSENMTADKKMVAVDPSVLGAIRKALAKGNVDFDTITNTTGIVNAALTAFAATLTDEKACVAAAEVIGKPKPRGCPVGTKRTPRAAAA